MIVVFGSINLDLVTRVDHIPAPGETVLGRSYDRIPGGKGANQALAARRAGSAVVLAGATGADEFAEIALSLLRSEGVDLSSVAQVALPTGAAFISVDARGQNAITVAAGANMAARGSAVEATRLGAGDILLLQREVPDAEGQVAAELARRRGGRVVLNLAPAGRIPDGLLSALDILVMNEHEAETLGSALGAADGADLARLLDQRFGLATVLTLGEKGAVAWDGGRAIQVAAPRVTVVDTTAAGDTFVGAFAAALDAGLDFAAALHRGVIAGSLACTRPGAQTSIPAREEIEALALGTQG